MSLRLAPHVACTSSIVRVAPDPSRGASAAAVGCGASDLGAGVRWRRRLHADHMAHGGRTPGEQRQRVGADPRRVPLDRNAQWHRPFRRPAFRHPFPGRHPDVHVRLRAAHGHRRRNALGGEQQRACPRADQRGIQVPVATRKGRGTRPFPLGPDRRDTGFRPQFRGPVDPSAGRVAGRLRLGGHAAGGPHVHARSRRFRCALVHHQGRQGGPSSRWAA